MYSMNNYEIRQYKFKMLINGLPYTGKAHHIFLDTQKGVCESHILYIYAHAR